MSLLALLGCAPATPRPRLPSLPPSFTATEVVAESVVTVFGFDGGPFVLLPERRLAAWRVEGAEARAVGPSGAGWYRAAAQGPDELWAVTATLAPEGQGSLYRLHVERAGAWEDRGPIPATSLTGLAVEGGGVGWVVGVRQLFHTVDGGASWQAVPDALAPGDVPETIGVSGPGGLLVGGSALRATTDGGATWATPLPAPVVATDGRWIVSGTSDRPRVGELVDGAVRWTGELPVGWLADRVRAGGGAEGVVRVRANKVGTSQLAVFESRDGGRTFARQRISGASDPAWVGLGEGVVAMDVERRLRAY
jgi:hypothetical protein